MYSKIRLVLILLFFLFLAAPVFADSLSPDPTLIGILFFKSDCIECQEVINQVIPEAFEKSGSHGGILVVNNSAPAGGQLFLEFLLYQELPSNMQLPILITENGTWSGKTQISNALAELLKSQLQPLSLNQIQNKDVIATLRNRKDNQAIQSAFWITRDIKPVQKGWLNQFAENYRKDPVGNGLAVVVLLGMIGCLLYIILQIRQKQTPGGPAISILYPVLCFLALLIATYLFTSGITEHELSCGPVGECNTVQQSEYASLFDLIPVSLLGMMGYLTCIVFWLIAKSGSSQRQMVFTIAAWTSSVISVCFFIYLTFLEPFVIGATCIWCVTSAVITTISALISTKPALSALSYWSSNRNQLSASF